MVEIPTAYGGAFGPDLGFVAAHNGLAEDEVVAIHSGTDYLVYMMGFSPGFTYLGGLSERIAAPRLDTPRTAIPAGSVGIAQMQTGIYPVESPGGWRLIGRTPVPLFDPSRDPPVLVDAGDYHPISPRHAGRVRLDPGRGPAGRLGSASTEHHAVKIIDVVDGGMLTTVQDLGRYGYQRYGVPTSGAMDLFSLRAANRLVGNLDEAAGLEMTLVGPRLRFVAPATIAVTGADLGARINGSALPMWQSVLVEAGEEIWFAGPESGIRAYLAVAGAVDVPPVLGSRSTYTRSKLGGLEGRKLQPGDALHVAGERPVLLGGTLQLPAAHRPVCGHTHALRVVLGPQDDRFTAAGIGTFLSSTYTSSLRSRTGWATG